MNDTIERIQLLVTWAKEDAAAVRPGVVFVGAFQAADRRGITCPRERSIYTALYLHALPRRIIVDPTGMIVEVEA